MRRSTHRARRLTLVLALLVGGCAGVQDIATEELGEGRFGLTIDNDFAVRAQGGERLLARKAEAICPDGYDRLRRRSLHKKRSVEEKLYWEIQCS